MKHFLIVIIVFFSIDIQVNYAQDNISIADSLNIIATKLYVEKHDYETAASLESIALKLLDSNASTSCRNSILMGLAPCLEDMGFDDKCRNIYLQVKEQLEADGNVNGIEYAYVLYKLADILMPDDMITAKKYIDFSKKYISEQKDFIKYAELLICESWFYYYQDDFDSAYSLALNAIHIFDENNYVYYPYDYAIHQAAFYAYFAEKHEEGIKWAEKAVSLRLATGGQKHLYYLTSLGVLAALYKAHEDHQLAVRTYDELLALYNISNDYGTVAHSCLLNSACEAYNNIGNYQKGLELSQQAMSIDQKLLSQGKDNALNVSYHNVAFCFDYLHQTDSAYFYNKKSIEIELSQSDDLQITSIPTLLNNAHYALELKQYDEAFDYINIAEKQAKKIKSTQNTTSALVDILKGHYYTEINEIKKAVNSYESAKKTIIRARGVDNEDYNLCCTSLMSCAKIICDEELLINNSTEYLNYVKSKILKVFLTMTPHQREKFWALHEYFLENDLPLYSSIFNNKDINGLAYDAILISKGILLSTDQSIKQIAQNSGDSITIKISEKIEALTNEYNEILSQKDDIGDKKYLSELSSEINEFYEKLIQRSNIYSEIISGYNITWQDVKSALSNDAVALEFCRIKDNGIFRYIALLITPDSNYPKVFNLCTEKELQEIEKPYEDTLLYNLIWEKIINEIGNVKTIYFAASGITHSIAIEQCLVTDDVRFVDKYEIYRLSSTRELVKKRTAFFKYNSVIYGGLLYEADEDDIFVVNQQYNKKNKTKFYTYADRGNLTKGFKYLPGTMKEASLIDSEIKRTKGNFSLLYKGLNGTEESFYSLNTDSVNILHFSTHGFCTLESEESNMLEKASHKISEKERALNRTGLVLSGANHYLKGHSPYKDMEDGILTSKEIASLHFPNLELVVLSACDTGVGLITSDGVFGLQRGFKKAGANGVVMTLWKVDDEATLFLMDAFYRGILSGKSAHESLTVAQNVVKHIHGFEDPYYWAGFILLDGLN